jgi:hypothetical protein
MVRMMVEKQVADTFWVESRESENSKVKFFLIYCAKLQLQARSISHSHSVSLSSDSRGIHCSQHIK